MTRFCSARHSNALESVVLTAQRVACILVKHSIMSRDSERPPSSISWWKVITSQIHSAQIPAHAKQHPTLYNCRSASGAAVRIYFSALRADGNEPDSDAVSQGLSSGAIAGIVIAVLLVLAILICVCIHKKRKAPEWVYCWFHAYILLFCLASCWSAIILFLLKYFA